MKMTTLLLVSTLCVAPSAARAGISLHIDIGLPVGPPPLVEVQPGIQVVEGFDGEVFFSGGWYWCRRPDGWYRARGPHDRFDWVDRRYVPAGMMHLPPGQYRNWHHGPNDRPGRGPNDRPGRGPNDRPGRGPNDRPGMRHEEQRHEGRDQHKHGD